MKTLRYLARREGWVWKVIFFVLMMPLFVNTKDAQMQVAPANTPNASPGGPDLTNAIERVGNPFITQYPDGDLVYARNVWDMQVFDDRLYFGYGNSNNSPPANNAGPVDIWSYDATTDSFTAEYHINEEQIDDFLVIGDQLLVPGHDTREAPNNLSSIYRLENGNWMQYRTLDQADHVYALAVFQGQLLAGVSALDSFSPVRRLPSTDVADKDWEFIPIDGEPLPPTIVWQFLPLGDELYLSASKLRFVSTEGEPIAVGDIFFQLQEDSFKAIPLDPFLGQVQEGVDELILRAVRTVEFSQHAVYVGAYSQPNGHQWAPFGLFSLRKDEANSQPSALPLVEKYQLLHRTSDSEEVNMLPWDTRIDGDTLYVLASAMDGDTGVTTNAIFATCDLLNWREVLYFDADTFARSFELYNGDFYFGMGSEINALTPDTGDIQRITHENYMPGCITQ